VSEPAEEQLNVYDSSGRVVGARPRSEAKSMGLAVGAVNVLIVNRRGEVLLQRRPADKENGGRWDKSVGGHVGAGEEFDETARRECGEELFDDGGSTRVRLVGLQELTDAGARDGVRIAPLSRHLNLRDVRVTPDGGLRNVLYHVGLYAGRTELAAPDFRPQASEIEALAFFAPAAVDAMLVRGELAPNMAFTWLAFGYAVLRLAGR
jgi:ADP-ribose pyrophosphatase YjhB (NUDIX family)